MSSRARRFRRGTSGDESVSGGREGRGRTYFHEILGVEDGEFVAVDQLVQPLLCVPQKMVLPDRQALLDADRELGVIVRTLRDGSARTQTPGRSDLRVCTGRGYSCTRPTRS